MTVNSGGSAAEWADAGGGGGGGSGLAKWSYNSGAAATQDEAPGSETLTYQPTWANAVEIAMLLFITTVEIIFRALEVIGNA